MSRLGVTESARRELTADERLAGREVQRTKRAAAKQRENELQERREQLLGQPTLAPEALRRVQLTLAQLVDEDTTLDESDKIGELAELLGSLGILRYVAEARPRRTLGLACEQFTGTLKGYRMHLRAYAAPCDRCLAARREELDARWTDMGLEPTNLAEVVPPT